jgi:hypothetical protein
LAKRVRRAPDERMHAMAEKRDIAKRISGFLDDDVVKGFFRAYEQGLVAKMIGADATDDDTRRAAALELRAFLAMKQHLSGINGEGQAAEQQLARMSNNAS